MENKIYKFGEFYLSPKFRTLTFQNENLQLNPRAFEILLLLVKKPGAIIEKKEILNAVWADSFVEENTLVVHVSALRKLLQEKDDKKYIETVTGRGYSFVAAVEEIRSLDGNTVLKESYLHLDAENSINEDAFRLYLKGRYLYENIANQESRAETLKQSLEWFQRAVEVDAGFALAYAWIGNIYCDLFNYSLADFKEVYPQAITAMKIALRVNGELADVFILKGKIHLMFEEDIPAAENAFGRAIELNALDPRSFHWQSVIHTMKGKFASALELQNQAVRLKPASPNFNYGIARTFYFSGEYNKAIVHAQETLKLDKRATHCLLILTLSYIELELFDEALATVRKYRQIQLSTEIILVEAYIHAAMGNAAKASDLLNEVLAGNYGKHQDDSQIATVYAALDNRDEAFARLEKAFIKGTGDICFFKVDPRFKNLRSDDRFAVFVRKLRLD